jgi:prepilin-type N-terminal cleavage/methylation domain-containing protein
VREIEMKSKRGFTLIELLVVIAVLAVLAAGVIVAINPRKRINQANDAKIRNDIGQIATALEAYYTTNQHYPTALADLTASQDLKVVPVPPAGGGGAYTYTANANCAVGAAPWTGCEATVYETLRDPLVVGNVWCWQSKTGTAIEIAACPVP